MDHLHLIDGSGFIYRAYYGMPALNRSDGLPVGAAYGYCEMLDRLLRFNSNPGSAFISVFDKGRRNWRHDLLPSYKSNRKPAPEDLRPQFPIFRRASEAYGVPVVEVDGYEADDIIATYARLANEHGALVTIHSSDKDLMQLVKANEIEMYDPMKKVQLGHPAVVEKWGVPPHQVLDVQALAGDPTDAIPGVYGIGVKIAAELIRRFGSLEQVLRNAGQVQQPARRHALMTQADMARLSYKLAALDAYVPDLPSFDVVTAVERDEAALMAFLAEFEFLSLTEMQRLPNDQ